MEQLHYDHKSTGGFIALLSVLILGAVLFSVSIGLALLGRDEGGITNAHELSLRAYNLAEACAEHALLRLTNDLNYSGGESIIVANSDACSVLAVGGVGNIDRIITTEAFVKGYKRRIRIDISQVRPLVLNSWQEVLAP